MKRGRAATFANHVFAHVDRTRRPYFTDWAAFSEAFHKTFYPVHESAEAMNRLESCNYHQGRRSVEDYVDEFVELIEKSGYKDGLAIVMKFRRGLDPMVQNRITTMIEGHPSDNDLEEWYLAAKVVALTRAANDAFHMTRPPVPTGSAIPPVM
jgi:hypothetical protein